MKSELEKKQAKKTARAKRADIKAMQERFDAIITVVKSITAVADDDLRDLPKLHIIHQLATGDSLDAIIEKAGREALGLA